MFKGAGLFSNVTCPNDQRCNRPHCPFKHSPVNSEPKKDPRPKALLLASSSGNRKLPSYAPQNSPAEPKVTVDYKQLIRGCKSYKSPGKEAKPNNLFEKFTAPNVHSGSASKPRSRSPRKQFVPPNVDENKYRNERPTSGKEKMPQIKNHIASSNVRNHEMKGSHGSDREKVERQKKSGDKPSLFEKLSGVKKPASEQDSHFSSGSEKSGDGSPTNDFESNNVNEFPQYDDSSQGKRAEGLVYRPGVGITSTVSGSKTVSPKKNDQADLILNSSLNFYDPYNNSTPTATSPSKANFNDTFEYQPFKPIDKPFSKTVDVYDKKQALNSSQESANASLEIEESSTLSDNDDETLLSEDDEIPLSDEDEIPQLPENDEPSDADESIQEIDEVVEVKVVEVKNRPNKLPINNMLSNKEINITRDDAVFGKSDLSPVKVRRTFQKKKASPEIIEIIKDEEDVIIEAAFKKDLEDQTRKKLFIETAPSSSKKSGNFKDELENSRSKRTKLIEDSPAKSFVSQKNSADESDSRESSIVTPQKSIKSGEESDVEEETEERKLQRQQKLEEIKLLKAKIFEKQWMQSKESSSSSASSSSSDSDSEVSGSEGTSKSDQSDSDYTINSDVSVKSEPTEEADTETSPESNNSDSEVLPKRKRKRLSSPLHSRENTTKVKPIESSEERKERKLQSKRSSSKNSSHKDASKHDKHSSRKSIPNHTILIESQPSCKLKRKKDPDSGSRDRVEHKEKERTHRKEKEHRKHGREGENKLKRKHKLKPGASANVRSDQIIPHQRKIAQRKMQITEKYDDRMCKNKEVDNRKTFYGANNPLMSKYKKEDLSHFDPPTPPPDEDPHRYGNLGRKNRGKRVAHKPTDTHAKKREIVAKSLENKVKHPGGPRLDIKERSHVPVAIRQTRLDYFITEYLKVWPNKKQKCFDHGLKAERSCLERCKTKPLYVNLCSNEVKKIRELKAAHSNGGASESKTLTTSKNTVHIAKQLKFHQAIAKYKISKEDMKKYSYPGYYEYKPVVLDGLHCVRCSTLFQLEDDGEYTIPERCLHHNGKLRTRKSRGFKGEMERSRIYDCCDAQDGSTGCSVGKGHVYDIAFLHRDWRGYVKTKRREVTPSVWGLDCEMCYTAGGVELTRVTVVDLNGDTALDMLIKPPRKVLDYNTRFSGIKASDLENVEHTLQDAQRAVSRLISWDCFIVGHSLESDLHALKLIHKNVVDTSVVYFDGVYKRGLAVLSAETLGRIIQSDEGGHDSTEDALAALDLMKHRLKVADNVKL
ncbi:putative RNA exonuclease pqe-1 [Bolinopsis microptera]|uniref:putative RNA exonuclease pqe-1 n=1 Tax=Bolinopsis microptera TaxID=2820187 RepID=UPI003079ACE0